MFDSDTVNVTMPSGPYPECRKGDGTCMGNLLPILTTEYNSYDGSAVPGTASVYWKCSLCGKVVR